MDKIKLFFERIESRNIGPGLWFGTAISIILVRDFLESLLDFGNFGEIDVFHFIHTPVFYFCVLLVMILILHLFSRTDIVKVSRMAVVFFAVIILPVFMDFLLSEVSGARVNYLYLSDNIAPNALNLFNPAYKIYGITYGMRLEILLVVVMSYIYLFAKKRNIWVSFIGALCVLFSCIFFISLPAFMRLAAGLFALNLSPADISEIDIGVAELVILSVFCLAWYLCYDRNKFRAILGNMRLTRSLHYLVLMSLGICVNFFLYKGLAENFSCLKALSAACAVFFAFQFSVVTNDVFDIDCDRVSNKSRPLSSAAITAAEYLKVGFIFLLFSLLCALYVNEAFFRVNLIFLSLYFVYSLPPLRLKRNILASALIIALEAAIVFIMGYKVFSDVLSPADLPGCFLFSIFLIFLFAAPFKDLKDIEGDKASGINTIPVVLGEKRGRLAVAFLLGTSYLLAGLLLPICIRGVPDLMPIMLGVIFALLNIFYVIRTNAKEYVVFLLYFLYAAVVVLYLAL